jgi:thiosulfate/3-mercaptopyruvate sulfurtransferase
MRRLVLFVLLAALCLCQTQDPWSKPDLMTTSELASEVKGSHPPAVICTAFPVLYKAKHIIRATFAGPGSKPEGIEMLKTAVAKLPKDADIVIYCGCCPMVKCPNVRPAFRALKEMGYTHLRVLDVPSNMHDDWYSKDYPSESGSSN